MNDLKFYTDDTLENVGCTDISHGFFTRAGGVSSGVYDSLNCAYGSGDALEAVVENRGRVASKFGALTDNLVSLVQVHGAEVVNIDSPLTGEVKADAMVTDKPGFALGVLTADCAPVLFVGRKDNDNPVIGAAHAGSKGALLGVVDNCLKAMVDLGAVPGGIKAAVGPCISKAAYEVSDDFILPFIDENYEADRFFSSSSKAGHAYFDLPAYCAWRLYLAGCKNVSLSDIDTYSNSDQFFSFRRSTHINEVDYGRQISVISIRK